MLAPGGVICKHGAAVFACSRALPQLHMHQAVDSLPFSFSGLLQGSHTARIMMYLLFSVARLVSMLCRHNPCTA